MSPDAQRIAIAEACGVHICSGCNHAIDPEWCHCGSPKKAHGYQDGHSFVPMNCTCGYSDAETMRAKYPQCHDYLNSLDAMHEAEKVLNDGQRRTYASALHPKPVFDHLDADFAIIHATAAQRAEAFLKTLNLWTPTAHPISPEKETP